MAHEMPQVDGVSHRFLNVDGFGFHIAEAGEGDPVILLHGWPQHWYCWRLVMPILAEHYHVIAVDLRGFGWTDIAWEGLDKESMAADIANVLAELDIDRARFVGHDWGGWIGFLLALRRPELVERLVALSIPPPFSKAGLRTLVVAPRFRYQLALASPLAIRRMRRPGYVSRIVKRWSRDRTNLGKDVRRLYARDLRASTRARATMLLYRTFWRKEIAPVLAGRYRKQELTVPCLVLHGEKDPVLPPLAYAGSEADHRNLTVEQVPEVGHMLPEERPELVARRALEFFAG
ncbi:MAG: alpha/beta hydrolase [Actinomycetota bacterium]|nr:alpha/beta hydrolase [Actinomycetota bacterium]